MGWDNARKSALLAANRIPLDVALLVSRNASGGGVGDEFLFASDRRLSPGAYLDPSSVSIQSAAVSVPDFRYQAGGFSVEINLPGDLSASRGGGALMEAVRRGSLCRLLVGFGSGDLADYLPYKLGVINNIKLLSSVRARIEVYDVVYALRSRPTPELSSGSPQTRLFHGLAGEETTLSAGYTAGATTVTLTSVTGFETFNGTGVAKLTGNSGAPFYVKFTGVNTGSKQLTGVTAGFFGTSDENAASGNEAVSCAYLSGHPVTVLWRLLSSTGAGTNGSQDVYPEAAGFGLDQTWLDLHSIREWTTALTPASGSLSIDLVVEEPVEDGLHYLGAILAELGIWVVQSEGQLSVRAAQDPSSPAIEAAVSVDDSMLLDFPTVDLYDPQVPYQYNRVEVVSASGTTGTSQSASVLPLRDTLSYDLSAIVWSNEGEVRTEVRNRIDDYGLYIPERISLTIRGAFTGLTPGDFTRLTSGQIRSRFRSALSGYSDRSVFVASVQENLIGGYTEIQLLGYPLSRSDDYA